MSSIKSVLFYEEKYNTTDFMEMLNHGMTEEELYDYLLAKFDERLARSDFYKDSYTLAKFYERLDKMEVSE